MVNCSSTIIWHQDRHARRLPPAHAATESRGHRSRCDQDLEFLIEQVTRFRKEQALKPLYTMVGSAAIVIAWIELFWRRCLLRMQVFWSLTATGKPKPSRH